MLEGTDVKFSKFNKNYSGFSGSLGLSYQLDKSSTLKLNLSRGFRAPNIAELASNGVHEGTFRYEIGDESLKSETSHQIDVAYFLNSDHMLLLNLHRSSTLFLIIFSPKKCKMLLK